MLVHSRFIVASIMRCVVILSCILVQSALAQGEIDTQGEVQLSIVSIGVGGLAREGDWTGFQVQVLDTGSAGRDVIIRLAIRDEDGDETQYDRVIASNPGSLQSYWLYSWIPFHGSQLEYTLKAFEAIDTGNPEVGEFGFKTGRQIGNFPIYNPQIQAPTIALTGVIGSNQLSLNQYGFSKNGTLSMPFGHELIRTSPGLKIENLPDRWQGLMSLDTLVWSSAESATTSPARLSPEKARAIRTWVKRGGHLVVVLPSSGDPWYVGTHPLESMMPSIKTPKRHEGVNLESYRTLLTESAKAPLPKNAVVYTFEPMEDQAQSLASPVLLNQDGECVVMRRHFGSGMVTVVGLPLNHGELRRIGLPDPESFWHRVLGLRGDILRLDQMTDEQISAADHRKALLFDSGVTGSIAKTGRAVQGIFFGVIVFILYWIIAGPGGYAILKAKSKKHHAWVVFVATTGVFTALAWMGATMLRPKSANITHLTLMEQVYGQDTQRSRSWMSVMLPSYGDSVVSLSDPDNTSSFANIESTNLIAPWTSPASTGSFAKGFPDNSGYRVESKNPSAIRVPTRATTKSFYSEWAGDANWSMPIPVGEPGAIEEPKLTVSGSIVSGQIVHDLPGPMENLLVFVVSREYPIIQPGQSLGRRMIAQVSVYSPTEIGRDGWEPGNVLDLTKITTIDVKKTKALSSNYFASSLKYGVDGSAITTTKGSIINRLIAGRFISQFEPPRYKAGPTDVVGSKHAMRRMLHGWDLGKWFTQPCVIVMGVVDVDQEDSNENGISMPIWIDGRLVPASGKTLVTWIYPLEAVPPTFLGLKNQVPVAQPIDEDTNTGED